MSRRLLLALALGVALSATAPGCYGTTGYVVDDYGNYYDTYPTYGVYTSSYYTPYWGPYYYGAYYRPYYRYGSGYPHYYGGHYGHYGHAGHYGTYGRYGHGHYNTPYYRDHRTNYQRHYTPNYHARSAPVPGGHPHRH
jgi:hypothetical protein